MDNQKERIIVAARKVFADKSYAKATISEIATEADVPRGSLHYYFQNKEDLFIQVMGSIYDESLGPLLMNQIGDMTPDQLAHMFILLLKNALETTPAFFRIIYESLSVTRQSDQVKNALENFWKRYRKDSEKMIEELQDRNIITSNRTPGAIVTLLITLGHGFAIQVIGEGDIVESEENWRALEDTLAYVFEK